MSYFAEAPGLFDQIGRPITPSPPSYIKGHRDRLRQRFVAGGADAIPDYEMLELLLFRVIPRRDVKPLAYALIDRFGDFNRVFAASPTELSKVPGIGPEIATELKVIEAAAHRLAKTRILGRHAISNWDTLLDYCRTVMAHRGTEQFRVLFLDNKNMLIADEAQGEGTVNHVPVYPREIIKRALELNASALILVHNHPSGDPTPSQADVDMTLQIQTATQAVSIRLHDHLIIGQSNEVSFRSLGLI